MIQDFQLRVSPRVAHYSEELTRQLAKKINIQQNRIKSVRVIKRSIDARQRDIYVNVTLRVGVDEDDSGTKLVAPIEYKPVSGQKQAIVVGMGPGGLFAALR